MEIRNALQKIENYLTVVSNLNKTILSEGTMSRDELLLMKKYLYTSIDRIEDIERSLIIDKREDKSFIPAPTVENKFVPQKEKEIVEVSENDHIEEVEAALTSMDQKEEMEDMVEDIHAEMEKEEMVFVGEIKPLAEEKTEEKPIVEITPLVESIITEDYSLNKLENLTTELPENKATAVVEEKHTEPVVEHVPLVESIITEDYSLNKLVEEKSEEMIVPVSETKSFAESIITEDFTLNKLFATPKEETLTEKTPQVENIITEDYFVNKLEEKVLPAEETLLSEKTEIPLVEKITPLTETLAAKFEVTEAKTFAEELVNKKKEETSLFEHLEQKLNATPQPQLFEMFDDKKEELHESFASNTFSEPVSNTFEKPISAASFEQNDTVLVAEKEVETVVEQLTPSFLNDIFKPQTVQETVNTKANKTLSESIALNDKFIFVRELFGNHFGEYEAGLKQLETCSSFEQAENYCKEKLWNKFNWSDKTAAVERFMVLLQKRFN